MGCTRVRNLGHSLGATILLGLALSVVSGQQAHGAPVVTSLSNAYLTATVGVSGDTDSASPAVTAAGRFGVTATGTSARPLMVMAANAYSQSYVSVRIDGGAPTPGADAGSQKANGWDLIFGDVGSNALNGGKDSVKTGEGAWLISPQVSNGKIVASWQTLAGSNTSYPIPTIQIDLELSLVHDMVWYKFTVTNKDTMSHTVALRFTQQYTGASADVPVTTPTLASIYKEAIISGASVPDYWRVVSGTDELSTGGLLKVPAFTGGNYIPVEKVVFGNALNTLYPIWDYTASTVSDDITDGAASVYFGRVSVGPQSSRVVNTFFGLQHSTIDFTERLAAGVDGPLAMTYDATKPVDQQWSPNPATITAFIHNNNSITLSNLKAVISLPDGLQLATGETATKTASSASPNGDATFIWHVVPTATAGGTLNYAVSFGADPGGQGISVARSIDLPALPTKSLNAGLQMVSFPYTFSNPLPATALGLSALSPSLLKWNPTTQGYEVVSALSPGAGYWMSLLQSQVLNLVGATDVQVGSGQFEIRLTKGWNQIGNPFGRAVRWGDVQVVNTDSTDPDFLKPLSVSEASDAVHRWVSPSVYWYDTSAQDYRYDMTYGTDLTPYVGYWVKSLKPSISLLISTPITRAAALPSGRAMVTQPSVGWKMRLVADSNGTTDGWNFIGTASSATDVAKPPSVSGHVALAVVKNDSDGRAATYAEDLKLQGATRKTWDVVVTTPAPKTEVTLTWPDVKSVPRSTELYLVDKSTSRQYRLRQTSSVRLTTGETGTRAVQIVAEPRGSGVFRINSVAVTSRAHGAATIGFTVSQDADVSVRILKATGAPLRTLVSRTAASGTQTQLTWDYRDNRGISVPAGSYLIEIRGTTSDGQSDRRIVPHVVTR